MFDWVRQLTLRIMRVPPNPEPPFGAAGSIRIFRAGRNYYNLRLFRWALGQIGATVGLCFSLGFFWWFKGEVELARLTLTIAPASVQPATPSTPETPAMNPRSTKMRTQKVHWNVFFREIAHRTPPWGVVLLEVFEVGGVLLFLLQIPVTYAIVRLEFEQHWYIVTDRSLRIRTGVLRLQESTMSFANLQQVEVKQGPLQRLLDLADVQVQSAGGGGDSSDHHKQGDSLHTGIFHSVEHATEIRDLILARLRQFRQAGLGDPEDHHDHVPDGGMPSSREESAANAGSLAAAQEILAEARALRAVLST